MPVYARKSCGVELGEKLGERYDESASESEEGENCSLHDMPSL